MSRIYTFLDIILLKFGSRGLGQNTLFLYFYMGMLIVVGFCTMLLYQVKREAIRGDGQYQMDIQQWKYKRRRQKCDATR